MAKSRFNFYSLSAVQFGTSLFIYRQIFMNTLSANSLYNLIKNWSLEKEAVGSLFDENLAYPVNIGGMQGSLYSFFIKNYSDIKSGKLLQALNYSQSGLGAGKNGSAVSVSSDASNIFIFTQSEREAFSIKSDLETIFEEAETTIIPAWSSVPYRPIPSGARIFGQRAGALAKMSYKNPNLSDILKFKPRIFIIPLRVLLSPLPPPDYIRSHIFGLSKKQQIDTIKLSDRLINNGYTRVPRVTVPGEFSLRGEVLDIFLPEEENPFRIIFDFDQIEEIKIFDADNQTTIKNIESAIIYPMKEVIWTSELIEKLENIFSEYDKNSIKENEENTENPRVPFTKKAMEFRLNLIENLKNSGTGEGEELFYPMLWDKQFSIFDYINKDSQIFFLDFDRQANAIESLHRELSGLYRKARLELPVFPPQDLQFDFEEIIKKHEKRIYFRTLLTSSEEKSAENLENDAETKKSSYKRIECEQATSYFGNINYLKEELKNQLDDGWKIFIFADNQNQALRIEEILKEFASREKNPLNIIAKSISEGFVIPDEKIKVIQENEIFGRRKYVPKSLHKAKSKAIDTFVELNPGDYVVHVNYGIGIFHGIDRIKALGNERDYIKLQYADEEFVFVPIEQLNLVQRYIGNEGEKPALDRIGSKSWENRKNKVKKSVEDLAEKLIGLYSRRQAAYGFPFPKDTEWQTAFEASFPYEDTPDQITVTEEIKKDMEKPQPMDRLLCGDVGYGKTEIAMRAAFKAVMGGKQVAFLAPTTILAEQHYETCVERFHNFPVKIAHLSRFVSAKEAKQTLTKLAAGEIDIIIGTHRIIQKDVVFKNLGLMIIDEEQRFGVKDKEKLKAIKNNIDCLSMSATPIPRTLHMSLLKIRDMSLLTTPPQIRKPIETIVDEYSEEKVATAIRREIERGGQVFYLHNRVESLNETRIKLERLLPEMLIDVAHGQMSSDELDDIFRRFKLGGFHVLVATTIIENGIDIPNVNTIIIDRADIYGISQLYQLRGRVGRSDKKAYAYLLYPENKSLSEIAMKRLQVISDFTELGSGFKIAMKDMEIRGAGNLLGRDQSGNVYSVGFDLYVRLLNQAVNRLMSQEEYKETPEVLMELEYTGFIPDSYVQNPQTKMEIYKKIASIQTNEELDGVYLELEDRFGPIPDEASSLLSLADIRIICRKLNIASIKEHQGKAAVEFAKVSDISIEKVLKLIRSSSGSVSLDPRRPNILILNTGKIALKEKSEFIREKLQQLA